MEFLPAGNMLKEVDIYVKSMCVIFTTDSDEILVNTNIYSIF